MTDLYACPKCKSSLGFNQHDSCLFCEICGGKYQFKNGVFNFIGMDVSFLSGDRTYDSDLKSILSDASELGWAECLRNYDKKKKITQGSKFEYATNLSRTDFKFLLPFNNSSTVLDIGGGLGLIAHVFAKSVKELYSIEKLRDQAEFIALRAKQESLRNIFVSSGGGDARLPFRDESFDLVILNGIFEWIGFETTFNNVYRHQVKMLKEVRRILKNSGVIWITTKNKYSINMICSKNLNNNNLRFVSVLPDKTINWVSSKLNGKQYLSGLKSVPGYKEVFESVALKQIENWVVYPNFRYPLEYTRYECDNPIISPTRFTKVRAITRIIFMLLPNFIRKRAALSNAFLLQKRNNVIDSNKRVIDKIISSVPEIRNSKIISLICPKSSSLSSSVIFVIKREKAKYIVKCNRYENLDFLKSEITNCQYVKENISLSDDILPEFISTGYIDGFNYTVMKYYEGYSLYSNYFKNIFVKKAVKKRLIENLGNILIDLSLKTKQKNNLSFYTEIQKPLEKIAIQENYLHFTNIFEECVRNLSKSWSNIPLVFEHCDLHIGNIIIRNIFPLDFKVVDWESCNRAGYPGVDFYNLINSFNISKHQREALLKNYCKQIEIDYKLIKYLALGRLIQKRENWRTKNRLEKTFEWKEREQLVNKRISEIISN